MSTELSEQAPLQVRRVQLDVSPPRAVHQVGWVIVGDEVLLEVGYFDLHGVSAALQKRQTGAEADPIDWFITDRFTLSLDAAQRLSAVLQNLATEIERIKAAGGMHVAGSV